MQILIPMAGAGQRFRDAGFELPKPLLGIDGQPMIARVVADLPAASKLVFVVHGQHIAEHRIDRQLLDRFPASEIVIAPELTQGQACTVQLGLPRLIPDEDVLVAACDNTHLYDERNFQQLTSDRSVDAVIWTYRREPRVLVNPNWYGWVSADEAGQVRQVSVKKPISQSPLNDHVISGTFWFRSAALLGKSIGQLISANVRVNNEFYLDSALSLMVESGNRVRVFEVDKYIGWGTPDDYNDYHLWSKYVRSRR